jgi:transketolase
MGDTKLSMGKANLDFLADTLIDLAKNNRDILIATSDSRGSGRVTPFAEHYPQQIVEIGIAEQNLVGVCAGLASAGKKVFAISPACFLTARGLEQIKNDVAYSNNPVKVIGISAGVSYGSLGTTHHSLHDFAVLQAINNIDIVAPADNYETAQVVKASIDHPRPLYIRFGKKAMPDLYDVKPKFEIGKAIQVTPVREGYDVALLSIGEAVAPSVEASRLLEANGLTAAVLSIHSLRPFDEQAVLEAAARSKVVITAEEHSIHGGLGSRVASLLMEKGVYRPLRIVGIPDEHIVTGSQNEIFNHYGLSASGLEKTALSLLDKGSK